MMRWLVVVLLLAGVAYGQAPPSPRSKQLMIGNLAYGSSDIWQGVSGYNRANRDWWANRMYWTIGSGNVISMDSIRLINGQMRWHPYYLNHSAYAKDSTNCSGTAYTGDTVTAKTWPNFNDSLFLRMGSNPGDTAWIYSDVEDKCAVQAWAPSRTGPGRILTFSHFMSGSVRYAQDMRFSRLGDYWGWRTKKWVTDNFAGKANGPMIDEMSFIKRTGIIQAGVATPFFPFKDTVLAYWKNWTAGETHPWRKIRYPYNVSWTHSQVRDSVSKWHLLRAQNYRDSMRAAGYEVLFNPAGLTGPAYDNPGINNNWRQEGRSQAVSYGGVVIGEYIYATPSVSGGERKTVAMIHACNDVKDSNVTVAQWGVRCGPCDSLMIANADPTATNIGDRMRTTTTAFFLACLFPGNSRYWFASLPQQFRVNTTIGSHTYNYGGSCGTMTFSDSTWMWWDGLGKYFGVEKIARDTSQAGTDPMNQAYKIWKFALGNPTDTSIVQTRVFMRLAVGTNYSAATAVNVSVDAGDWFPLNANGTYGEMITGPTTYALKNSQSLILVSDTILANTGVSDTILSISNVTQSEATTPMTFTVRLSPSLSSNVSFQYFTTDGSAIAPGDYTERAVIACGTPATYVGTILAGQTSTTVTVPIVNDATVEPDENFTLTLKCFSLPGLSNSLTDSVAVGTITNDDAGTSPTYVGKRVKPRKP